MPSLSKPQEEEKIYFLKLCKLLIDVGTPVLKDVFDSIHSPKNLSADLNDPTVKRQLQVLQKQKVLYQKQMDILYPMSGCTGVTSMDFDISLLIILLRNICSIESPGSHVWKKQPMSTDVSTAHDIMRVRNCRNNLFHAGKNASVTECDFNTIWPEIKDALIRLGGKHREEDIQNIYVGQVDPAMEEYYRDLLKSREEGEARLLDKIDNIEAKLKELEEKRNVNPNNAAEIDIKVQFKLLYAGAVIVGSAFACTHFLRRYVDDPETILNLVQFGIMPSAVVAAGASVVAILRGCIIIRVQVSSLIALDYLWKSYTEGAMEQNLKKVIVTDELMQHAPDGTDSVELLVTMSEGDVQKARCFLLGAKYCINVEIRHHKNLPKPIALDEGDQLRKKTRMILKVCSRRPTDHTIIKGVETETPRHHYLRDMACPFHSSSKHERNKYPKYSRCRTHNKGEITAALEPGSTPISDLLEECRTLMNIECPILSEKSPLMPLLSDKVDSLFKSPSDDKLETRGFMSNPALLHLLCSPKRKKLAFLAAVGSQCELKCQRVKRAHPLTMVEQDMEKEFAIIVKFGRWDDPRYTKTFVILNEMRRPIVRPDGTTLSDLRDYDYGSVAELLRLISDAIAHFSEARGPPAVRMMVLEADFLDEFPNLFVEVYKAVTKHGRVFPEKK